MHDIAIIGTEGVGKTVFISTLAHDLTGGNELGLFLNPQNPETQIYTGETWLTLSKGEWPAATPPGTLFKMKWHLEKNGQKIAALHMIDPPGHDLRLIFAKSSPNLPDGLKELAQYCREANVAVFLINLDDYIPNPKGAQIQNQAILKASLDSVLLRNAKACIVFTQANRYDSFLSQSMSSTEEPAMSPTETTWYERVLAQSLSSTDRWLAAAAKHLPIVYGAHLKNKNVAIFPVSCVGETEREVSTEGIRELPKPGFCSEGMKPFLEWLLEAVAEPAPPPPPPPPGPGNGESGEGSTSAFKKAPWPLIVAGVAAFLVFIVLLCNISSTDNMVGLALLSLAFAAIVVFPVIWGVLAVIRLLISEGKWPVIIAGVVGIMVFLFTLSGGIFSAKADAEIAFVVSNVIWFVLECTRNRGTKGR